MDVGNKINKSLGFKLSKFILVVRRNEGNTGILSFSVCTKSQ